MAIIGQFVIGLIFGLGLVLSGMSDPAKVLNFLDLGAIGSGGWDPSLAFVMAGAVAVTFAGYKWALKRPGPLFGEKFHCQPVANWTLGLLPVRPSLAWGGDWRAFAQVRP